MGSPKIGSLYHMKLATIDEMRPAIQKECAQIPIEIILDVCDVIALRVQ